MFCCLFLVLAAAALAADSQVIDLKVMVTLGAFNVLVCDQKSNMADIKIQGQIIKHETAPVLVCGLQSRTLNSLSCPTGINGLLVMQGPQTHVSARLRDLIVLNVDPRSLHEKVSWSIGHQCRESGP